jgi:two-component system LytT family response regulator
MTAPTTTPIPPLRCLIVDDELLARKRMERLLLLQDDVVVAGVCADADAALAAVAAARVDVVFLDIHMPGLSGLEVAERLPEGDDRPAVVFATAWADHAVDAFALGAVDYLLKPIDDARLARAVERARKARPRLSTSSPEALQPLAIPTRRGVVLVSPADITHALLENDLVTVYAADGAVYVTDFSVADLQERLPADRFIRVHRRALVNLWHVALLQPLETGGYTAVLPGEQRVVVSRAAARELRRRLGR